MKNMFSLLFCIFAVIACKVDPIEPEIIGTGILTKGVDYYTEVNGERYAVTSLLVAEHPGLAPVASVRLNSYVGKTITCFTTKLAQEPQFILGDLTAEEIENLYDEPCSDIGRWLVVLGIMMFIARYLEKRQKKRKKITQTTENRGAT